MKKLFALLSGFLPVFAFAGATTQAFDALSLIRILQNVVDAAIPFVIGLGILVFIYGVFQFVASAGDEEARANAKHLIIWGIIGIFVMVSVWGLVHILVGTFNLQTAGELSPNTYSTPLPRN